MSNLTYKLTDEHRKLITDRLYAYLQPSFNSLSDAIHKTLNATCDDPRAYLETLNDTDFVNVCSCIIPLECVLPYCVSENGIYNIPVSWSMSAIIQVEADNLQDAIDRARQNLYNLPLPKRNANYVEDSFEIDVYEQEDAINAADYTETSGVILHRDDTVTKY